MKHLFHKRTNEVIQELQELQEVQDKKEVKININVLYQTQKLVNENIQETKPIQETKSIQETKPIQEIELIKEIFETSNEKELIKQYQNAKEELRRISIENIDIENYLVQINKKNIIITNNDINNDIKKNIISKNNIFI
jgi:hypothetical protein